MKNRPHVEPAPEPQLLTLAEVVATVRGYCRNDAEAARVVNHLLLTRRIRFVRALDRDATRALDS